MASIHTFSAVLFVLVVFSSNAHLTLSVSDVHEILHLYGLPKGLLPGNVESYTLQNETGSFSIHLSSPCYVDFNPLVYYDTTITGNLNYGAVTDISGIQAKNLFLWVKVTAMKKAKDSDFINFYVGSLSQQYPIHKFQNVRQCQRRASLRSTALALDSMR